MTSATAGLALRACFYYGLCRIWWDLSGGFQKYLKKMLKRLLPFLQCIQKWLKHSSKYLFFPFSLFR